MTLANTDRFVWNDAAINRDTNNLVSAALADEKGRCDMSDFPFGGEYRA